MHFLISHKSENFYGYAHIALESQTYFQHFAVIFKFFSYSLALQKNQQYSLDFCSFMGNNIFLPYFYRFFHFIW